MSIKLTQAVDDSAHSLGKSSHQQQQVPSLSLKISTAHLKRISPSLSRGEREGSKARTASPESVLSASESVVCVCLVCIWWSPSTPDTFGTQS